MEYALVEDGQVVSTDIPQVGELLDEEGEPVQVSGFNKLDEETLKSVGWLPIEEPEVPNYDPETQVLESTFEVQGEKVVLTYTVNDIPAAPPAETDLLARVAELEKEVKGIKDRTAAAQVSNADAAKIKNAVVGPPS